MEAETPKQYVQHIYDFEGDKIWASQCVTSATSALRCARSHTPRLPRRFVSEFTSMVEGHPDKNMPTIVGLSLAQLQCAVGELWDADKNLETVEVVTAKEDSTTASTPLEKQQMVGKVFRRIAVKFSQALQLWMFRTLGAIATKQDAIATKLGA